MTTDEKNEVNMVVAERLKIAMEMQEMSAEELAEKSGIPISKIQQFLNGKGNMMLSHFGKIAKTLDVSGDYLIGTYPYPIPLPKTERDYAIKEKMRTMSIEDMHDYLNKTLQEMAEHQP